MADQQAKQDEAQAQQEAGAAADDAGAAEQQQQHERAEQASEAQADGGGAEGSAEAEAALQRVADLEVEVKEATDDLVRALAEIDNVRKAKDRELQAARQYGLQRFATDLVGVLDTFERALQASAELPDDPAERAKTLDTFHDAMRMTYDTLQKTLARHNLERYDPMGQPFDPQFHEALYQMPSETAAKNEVVQVVKVGYKLHDRVIRPAQVGTAQ